MIQTDHQALEWMLNLKESMGRLACWKLKLLEIDFEIVLRIEKYHKADAMSRLPQKAANEAKRIAEFDDDILAYCILGGIIKPNMVLVENDDEVGPLPTTGELIQAQASGVVCQYLMKVLGKTEK